jgi:6-phosphogluconolactonase (cycloisomerase 2 family)
VKQPRRLALYASTGSRLLQFAVDVDQFALWGFGDAVSVTENVQYACPDISATHLYAALSNGAPGTSGDAHYVTALRIDSKSGTLFPHGEHLRLPSRPVHITTDARSEHVLIVYTELRTVTVIRIAEDGKLGPEVKQPHDLDTGVFAHQVFVAPSNDKVIVVARGIDAAAAMSEVPGCLKVFGYRDGVLSDAASVAPGGGFGFGPRNLEFHPSGDWLYVSLERQNRLCTFRVEDGAPADGPVFQNETLVDPRNVRPRQMAGAVHVHPSGRFIYVANRAFGTIPVDGKDLFAGGENSIVVYRVNPATGEPQQIQNIETQGIYPRTFSLDPDGRMLVAGNLRHALLREGAGYRSIPANLAVFSIGSDGRLTFVRTYEPDCGGQDLFWSGMVRLPIRPE